MALTIFLNLHHVLRLYLYFCKITSLNVEKFCLQDLPSLMYEEDKTIVSGGSDDRCVPTAVGLSRKYHHILQVNVFWPWLEILIIAVSYVGAAYVFLKS
ncbi:hypothetical protein A6856_23935 [Salmonella enterica]|nr:hypothetical protein [Salmonella enterica]EAS2027943.1 hypothetical protein [Salmonella enterica]EAU0259682.1 hypothetical protein [Salmonella enterica]